jgi:hypothetical protein
MMESPAFRTLTHSARRVLDRIEIEHAHHGGNDNGQLPVTYDQFIEYGIHHNAIAPAIREIEALGFIEITKHGRAGNAEWRRPNKFRLTYRYSGRANPTDDWRKIRTTAEAEMVAKAARTGSGQKHFPIPVDDNFHPRNRYRKCQLHTPKTGSTGHTPETGSTSIFRNQPKGGSSREASSAEGGGYALLEPPQREPFLEYIAAVVARQLDQLA